MSHFEEMTCDSHPKRAQSVPSTSGALRGRVLFWRALPRRRARACRRPACAGGPFARARTAHTARTHTHTHTHTHIHTHTHTFTHTHAEGTHTWLHAHTRTHTHTHAHTHSLRSGWSRPLLGGIGWLCRRPAPRQNREPDRAAFCRRKSEALLQKASIARRNERNLLDAERFSERN